MANDKLVKGSLDQITKRFDPAIQTSAKPEASDLLEARRMMNMGPVRLYVEAAQKQGIPREQIIEEVGTRLDQAWGGSQADTALECARYLFDEFEQLGEGLFVVSNETGQVVAALTEKDFYDAAPVPREGGGLAERGKQIRPEIHAALFSWVFDAGREQNIVATLAAHAHQTAFLKENGDNRLLVATRSGRRHIVSEFAKRDPHDLLLSAGGTSGRFLQHFEIRDTPPEGDLPEARLILELDSQSTMGVQDMTTTNLHHSRPAALQGALVQGWIREMARHLSVAMPERVQVSQRELTKEHLHGAPFWVAPPEAHRYLRRAYPVVEIMPVVGSQLLGFRDGQVGCIVVPREFNASNREWFDRWEVMTTVQVDVWIDWTKLHGLELLEIEHEGIVV